MPEGPRWIQTMLATSLTSLMTGVFGGYCEQRLWLHVGLSGAAGAQLILQALQWDTNRGVNSVDSSYNLLPLPQALLLIPSLCDLGQVTWLPLLFISLTPK